MNSDAPALSVVVPAFNEELLLDGAIRRLRHTLDELRLPAEIIIVNDGSHDRTGAIADTLAADPASFRGSNMAVLRQVFGMPWARITIGKLKAKLNDWSRTIHPDKVQHMSPRVVRLAKQTYVPVRDLRPADQPP